ncbi:MAG: hypothetical protein NVSMB51_05960 [Solirubrobacteraceae bacterium]
MRAVLLDADPQRRARFGAALLHLGLEVAALAGDDPPAPLELLVTATPGSGTLGPAFGMQTVCVLGDRAGTEAQRALDAGADAVVAGTASAAEFAAVIGALLRRRVATRREGVLQRASPVGAAFPLSRMQAAMLDRLARRPGELLGSELLARAVWPGASESGPAEPKRALAAHAARLRATLRPFGWTVTGVRGAGYVLEPLRPPA